MGGYSTDRVIPRTSCSIYVCVKEEMSLRESLCLFAANSGVEKRHGGGRDAEKSVCRDYLSWEKCTFASIKLLYIIRQE